MTKLVLRGSPAFAAENPVNIVDLGFMDYADAHETQLRYVDNVLTGEDSDTVLLVEHPPVFTLGRQGRLEALVLSRDEIRVRGIDIIHTERGGDVTYHGPGQIVVYPIIQLRRRRHSVANFIEILEEIMIRTAADFGVNALRDRRNRGVWVGDSKMGSVGIRVRQGISFHGLAFNVTLSLTPFSWIQPCGLSGVGVTSLAKQLDRDVDIDIVKQTMKGHIKQLL